MSLHLYHGATRGLAVRTRARRCEPQPGAGPPCEPEGRAGAPRPEASLSPGVRAGLVVPLDPQGVRVVGAGDPDVRHVALGDPTVGPIAGAEAAPRDRDVDRLWDDDHRGTMDDVGAPMGDRARDADAAPRLFIYRSTIRASTPVQTSSAHRA